MSSAAPLAARPAPSLFVAVACLSLVGCGNRGELYLPSEAGLEVDDPALRSPPELEEAVEPEGRTLTPPGTANGLASSGTGDDQETDREGQEGNGDEDGPARARGPVVEDVR